MTNEMIPLYVAWSGKRNDTSASVRKDTMPNNIYNGDHTLYGMIWAKPGDNLIPFYKAWSGKRHDTGFCVGQDTLDRNIYDGDHELMGYISKTPENGATLPLWVAWSGKRHDTKLLIGDNFDTNIYDGDRGLLGYIRSAGEVELIRIDYEKPNYSEMVKIIPTHTAESTLTNDTDEQQTTTATFSYTEEQESTFTWKNTTSAALTVSAGLEVPFLTKGKIKFSIANKFTIGQSKTEKKVEEKNYEFPVVCPPHTSCIAKIVVKHGTINVPFTANLRIKGADVSWQERGIYTGTSFSGIDASVKDVSEA